MTTDTKRKIPLPLPATTLIKIETDATTLDQTKTLQAVSTMATNTATVFTDQSVAPLLTTHVIYQHPTNLILSSQTPAPEASCRSQATSPVTCLTPPPDNIPQPEEESLSVQDASNQTDSPICSEDDNTTHAVPEITADAIAKENVESAKENRDDDVVSNVTPVPEDVVKIVPQTEKIAKDDAVTSPPAQVDDGIQNFEETTNKDDKIDYGTKPDLSGLELLSNSIVAFENCLKDTETCVKHEIEKSSSNADAEQGEEVLNGMAHMSLKDHDAEFPQKVDDSLGGLGLLCALAEQRIMEEVTENKKIDVLRKEMAKMMKREERKKEKRKSKRHSSEPKPKKSKHEHKNKMKHEDLKETVGDKTYCDFRNSTFPDAANAPKDSDDVGTNMCNCKDDNYRTYKTKESEEEVRKFIASKSLSLCCKGEWPCMNQNELNMRMRLADLQKKYREKQRELHKLKVRKHSEHKEGKNRKKSTNSDRNSPPPPVLDKMDVPVKQNREIPELLRPPTLCAQLIDDDSSAIQKLGAIKETEGKINDAQCYSPLLELSDSTPEKISSSQKRKVGRPKKLMSFSGLQATTETIVAKKPKKGNIVSYLLAAKEKLMQNNKDGLFYSNSPPRFVEETSASHKYRGGKTDYLHEDAAQKKKHSHSKLERSKLRPKLKAEPTRKQFLEEEEVQNDWGKEDSVRKEVEQTERRINKCEVEKRDRELVKLREEIKAHKCVLTREQLEMTQLRVLTVMGGLFYAGHLNPVRPPDVYSITLDGERGNKPHILSREDILKDAVSSHVFDYHTR